MSDGTQDQLYLALRLASLEKFSAEGEPLPLLADAALVNLENTRARGDLKALGNLGAKTQVIFFTQHQHMVHLATKAIDRFFRSKNSTQHYDKFSQRQRIYYFLKGVFDMACQKV